VSSAYLIIYEGQLENPEEFLRYYIEKHLPIVWTFPKISRIEVDRGVDSADFFMITRLTFDTIEDLRAAIVSKQRERARADMNNFPPFKGTVRREAVEIMEITREGF